MKKRLLLLFLLLAMPFVLAEDTFTISFHSIGGNASITLDLVRYLNNSGPFKYSPVENVNIAIGKGIATITPKDPAWVGIEDITFAPIDVEIKPPKKDESKFVIGAKRNITISDAEIDTSLGPLVEPSFYLITGNRSAEQINISGFVAKDSLSVELNNEVSLNISLGENSRSLSPKFVIDVHSKKDNLTLAEYEEPSSWPVYAVLLFILVCAVAVFGYFYTGYGQDVLGAMVPSEPAAVKKSASSANKRSAELKLSGIGAHLTSRDAKDSLKQALSIMESFLSDYLHLAFVSQSRIVSKLSKQGASASVQGRINSVYEEYSDMVYGEAVVSKAKVSAFISKVNAVIRQL